MSQLLEFTEYYAPDGEVYRFEAGDKFMMSVTGMGMPPISYITQRGPFQHGETYVDYRLDPRIIQLVERVNACSRPEYWNNRANILNLLRPNRNTSGYFNPGVLRKVLPGGAKRDIKVYLEQGPIFQPRDNSKWDEWAFTETLRFVAPYPVFYDPTMVTVDLSLAANDQLVFPITFPIIFGLDVLASSDDITYPGTWLSYPTITITGPLNGAVIQNESTGEIIHLNYTIPIGETVTINLEPGYKTITTSGGVNLIGAISVTSDLATFHLAPDPEVAGGVNTISVIGAGGMAGVTAVCVGYYAYYIGI